MKQGVPVQVKPQEASWLPAVRERLLERAVDAAENGIVIADATASGCPILYANPSFARITGRSVEEPGADLCSIFSETASGSEVMDQVGRCIAESVDCTISLEAQWRGTSAWYELIISPVRDPSGRVSHLIGVLLDISDRVSAERVVLQAQEELATKVKERTEELQRINKDLEGFSYSVSHDLRAPLRAIMGFSKVLVEDYGREVDVEMRHTLDRINAAATRMSAIIEDLLTFSRLGRKELVRQRVDLTEIAEAVGSDLSRAHPQQRTRVGVDPDMIVQGDPTLLRVAVENLLDNAFKFTSKRDIGKVEFRKLGEHRFVVRDNGAGFEPQYSEKLFRPFERLHSASEFPGTGIGLANVRRIIERHGGRVWAEGEPEKGASFYFEL